MVDEAIVRIEKDRSLHALLIGAPLTIVAVFCFSFVMMHPAVAPTVKQAASNNNKRVSTQNTESPYSIASPADMPKLVSNSASSSTESTPATTSTPLPASPPSASLQSAVTNNQTTEQGTPLDVLPITTSLSGSLPGLTL